MKPLESLLRVFVELHPEDAARAFETPESAEGQRLFKNLPLRVAVPLLERLSPHAASPLLGQMDSDRIRELITAMSPRAASTLLHQLDEAKRVEALAALPENLARSLRELIDALERPHGVPPIIRKQVRATIHTGHQVRDHADDAADELLQRVSIYRIPLQPPRTGKATS